MRKPPGKKETLLAYLERGIAMLHLDARREGVEVPEQHEGDPHLRLNLSYRYSIPDLTVDDERVVATLSFRSRPFRCVLPWSAVFGITSHKSGEGQVWPEDLPIEVVKQIAQEEAGAGTGDADEGAEEAPAAKRRRAPRRPALQAVETPPEAAPAPPASPEEAPVEERPAPSRSHLRLVK